MPHDPIKAIEDKLNADPSLKALFEKAVAGHDRLDEKCGRAAPTDAEEKASLETVSRLHQSVTKLSILADIALEQMRHPSRPFDQIAKKRLKRELVKYK